MIRKNEITRQKLFDGDEQECLKEIFEIENQKIRLIDFYNNPLRDLKKELAGEIFDTIVRENNFNVKNSFMEKYRSEEGLEVHYLIKDDILYLFSFGEFPPGRYMLFLESIYHYNRQND
ncbi:hypothetical protein QE422_001773 [Chryseobacterium sp. SORGH_AS 447]|uniref:hypothetical protein n=1 Tax=Chryseobacterium sp. SORGH_AS_0447 TaxID=3041769 RepID=UPI002787C3DC|nr:hypothetical protein [Chryseobacterium sp. SORGH_AS_0447]MDQ1161405.1 hypothetical protein [Chryseobacterium sp. SORGH_AS_0447]